MCRLYGFRSSVPSRVHHSLVAAENALALQSLKHPDGWGVAYYNGRFPQLIRSEKQALEDGLFRELGALVSTRTLLAHIRQATAGRVGVLNCHPFQHGPWTFAHNGSIAGYSPDTELHQAVLAQVDPRFRSQILGQTDSELCFYIFLSRLARRVEDIYHESVEVDAVLGALSETVDVLLKTAPDADSEEPNRLSFLLTNGSLLVGLRFRRELNYSTYKTVCPERDTCSAYDPARCEHEVTHGIVKHLIVTSERIAANPNVWHTLDDGDYVSVNHAMVFRRGCI